MDRVKRAILKAPGILEFEELTIDPGQIGENEIYAKTIFSAVSIGTEGAAFKGHPPLRPGNVYPRLVGYCNAARVAKVGQQIRDIRIGDCVLTHQSHQSAYICKAEAVLAVLPENVPPDTGSMAYLAHLGWEALQRADFRPGEKVAILGLGVIGLATVGVAKASGAFVVAVGNDKLRLEKARELGAMAGTSSDHPDLPTWVADVTGGEGLDLIVTTVNSWDSWETALKLCRFQSRIAVLGFPGRLEGAPAFNPLRSEQFHDKQLSIHACGLGYLAERGQERAGINLKRNMRSILRLVAQGDLRLDKLITHRVPWSQLHSIYDRVVKRDKSLIGAVLEWGVPEVNA